MSNIPKIVIFVVAIGLFATILLIPPTTKTTTEAQTKIVTTIFPAYDFARTLSTDIDANIKLLIRPGVDLHSFEPTPQDIIDIKNSDIFIYNGGESEQWVAQILSEINTDNTTIIRMMDSVELLNELDGPDEYDEHVWTAPLNVIRISQTIAKALTHHSPNNTAIIQHNLDAFTKQLQELDHAFQNMANTKTGTLIVADRFPFQYFINAYHFNYLAAFPGCSEQTEASAKVIANLSTALANNPKKVVFHLELSNKKIAQTVASTANAIILEWHSVHNISQADFDAGKTYLDFMRQNLNNINEALSDAPESNES